VFGFLAVKYRYSCWLALQKAKQIVAVAHGIAL